ncbi:MULTISPECIES: hypothetical protein [unclassified Pseudomonas]|uniref:hypothetical protein n=1 Tax=unclassified Pseudomonas TaxID=196821 RepID=UPI002AC9E584|nr:MULTISPECIES: hypothetical protein [unclassified Pseudomonas]MEB0039876.1 hypothetical protein [Pseudomonas sp. MH10]MEB0120640.1 hypothetical protein [Pseudomonas sp. CCI1.2]WPX64613.1 hypothetical protein RHM59_02655 [Pseudomonas sp. MH10]
MAAVIFDMDGLLLDAFGSSYKTTFQSVKSNGLALSFVCTSSICGGMKLWFRFYSEAPFSTVGTPNRKKVPKNACPTMQDLA